MPAGCIPRSPAWRTRPEQGLGESGRPYGKWLLWPGARMSPSRAICVGVPCLAALTFMFSHPVRAGGGAQGEMGTWHLSLLQASCPSRGLPMLTVWGDHTLPAPLQGQHSIPFFSTPQGCPPLLAVTPGGD